MMPDRTHRMMDHLFRHEAGKMVAVLTARFGLAHLQSAEDAVQDAFMQARRSWLLGPPDEPAAWLMRTAQNRFIDSLRRAGRWKKVTNALPAEGFAELPVICHPQELADAQLKLMFACCHPALNAEDRFALTLKTVSGFSAAEIARGLLLTEGAVQKRLERARAALRAEPLVIPAGSQLGPRLRSVLSVLYLLFNEGYNSAKPEEPIRHDLCAEAMRCVKLLGEHPVTACGEADALLALMCLHAARFDGRLDELGALVRLEEQDRSRWDRELIAVGYRYLEAAGRGNVLSRYHLEAAIAAEHCRAATFADTDWRRLLYYYNLLQQHFPSPLAALNRAVVLAEAESVAAAIEAVLHIPNIEALMRTHYLFPAVLGDLYRRLSEGLRARELLLQAQQLTASKAEQELLQRKIDRL